MGLPLYVAPVESDLSARAAAKARDTARSPIRRVRHRINETRENRRRTNWLDDIDRFVEFATQRPTSVPPPNTSSTSTARLASSNTSTSTSTPTPAPGSLPFPPPAVPATAGNAQSTGSRQNSELSIVETGSPRDGNTRRILIVDATGLEAVLVDDTHYRYLRRMDDPASLSGGWVHDGISERTLDLPRDPASQNRDDILANAEYILNNRGREAQRLISESQRLLDESESQLARVANTLNQSANSEHTRDTRPTGHMGQIPLRRPSRWSRRDRIQDSATLTVPGEASIRWTRVATPPYRTSAARGYLASRAVHRSRTRAYPSSSTPLALLRTQLSQVSQPSSPRRALRFDGLGDRERSLSPEGDGVWDTLLTTLTPDPQPPSVGSSFASTNPSTTASQSAAVSSNTSLAAHEQGDSLEFGEQTSYEDSDPDGEFLGNDNEDEEEDDDPDEDEDTDETMVDLQREIDHARSYADVAAIDDGEDLDSLQHIMRSLAHREDIPDDWWLGAGLRRNLARRSS